MPVYNDARNRPAAQKQSYGDRGIEKINTEISWIAHATIRS